MTRRRARGRPSDAAGPEASSGEGAARRAESSARSLTRVAGHGFVWSFGGGAALAVLGIANVVILARFLTPTQFGEAAAATLVVGLVNLFSQVGFGPALVQRKELRDEEVSAALVASAVLSVVLALLLFFLSPLVSPVVGLSSGSGLLSLMSVSLLLGGLATVPAGLLQRRYAFRETAAVDFLAASVGGIGVTIVLATQGFGAYSLVWGTIATGVIRTAGYWLPARPVLRLRGPRQTWRDLRPLVGFGSGYSIAQLGNWVALNADNFVTANVLGPTALGIYSRAYRLHSQPADLIGGAAAKVLYPAMAEVRDDAARLRKAYLQSTSLVALVTVPVSVLVVVLAPEVVDVLLGGQWTSVVLPLQVLGAALVPRTAYRISQSFTRATGAVYAGAWRQWVYAVGVLGFCAVGARRAGVDGVAVGAALAILLNFAIMLQLSARFAPGLVRSVLGLYGRKYVPLAALVLLVTYPVAVATRPLGPALVTLALVTAAGACATALFVGVLHRAFAGEMKVLKAVVRRRRRRAGDVLRPSRTPGA